MGTMHPVVTLLTLWTLLSVVLVGAWSLLSASSARRVPATVRVHEPRSHVRVIDGAPLATVIDLSSRRSA